MLKCLLFEIEYSERHVKCSRAVNEIITDLSFCPMVTRFSVYLVIAYYRATNMVLSKLGFFFLRYNSHPIKFKVCISVSLSALYNHHHCVVPEPKRRPHIL